MKRKIIGGILAAVMIAGLAACGAEDPNIPRYSLVTNKEGISTEGTVSNIWNVVESTASSSNHKAALYTAAIDTQEAYLKAIDKAVDDKSKLVIAYGKEMEIPVYNGQNAHHGTKFFLIDGQPREKEGSKADIRSNTCSITFLYEQEGFVAGYAAVKEGFRNLAFMAGGKTDENIRYCGGFVQGAEQAASELSLANGSVKIRGVYEENDELSPLRMAEALKWYNDGTEIVFTVGSNLSRAVAKAADAVDRRVISAGVDLTGSSDKVLFAMVPVYETAVKLALASFEEKKGFQGGKDVEYGVSDGCIKMSVDFARFAKFTESDYNAVLDKIKNGSITVSADEVTAGNGLVGLTMEESQQTAADTSKSTSDSTASKTSESGTNSTVSG
ncbi:MAG TPA: BMP family ABC transporter substrate-binding protein [Lachnospiraceae bacterium]|nr:BMP family ABC transporter substrate-binding protein [Lachnospiraceae bacterium]